MTYSKIDAALKTVLPDATFHLSAPPGHDRYIIWAETGSHSQYADGVKTATAYQASVYVYTQNEDDNLLNEVCEALDLADIPYDDPVPGYDDELQTMGTILECEVI